MISWRGRMTLRAMRRRKSSAFKTMLRPNVIPLCETDASERRNSSSDCPPLISASGSIPI